MRATLLLVYLGAAALALSAPMGAAAPSPHAHGARVTVRDAAGAIVRWGALPFAECEREEAHGRVVADGEPGAAEQRAWYLARDGRAPGEAPACQVELDAVTGRCVGWRYGPPAVPAPGRVVVQREPTVADATQVETARRRRALEDALIRAMADRNAATSAGLADRAIELDAEIARLRAELGP